MRLLILVLIFHLSCFAMANDKDSYHRLRPVPHNVDNHSGHAHSTQTPLEILPSLETFREPSSDQLTSQMVDDIHEISHDHLERKSLKNFAAKWIHQFNLIRHGQDLIRWADSRIFINPTLKEHAHNLGLLFGASHLLETLSGPIGMMIGSAAGLPDAINWSILATGAVISVPGLDPVCIILAASYKVSPGFRMRVTKMRLTMQRVSSRLVQQMRLPQFMARFGQWQSGQQRILGQFEAVDNKVLFQLPGGEIQLQTKDDVMWLHQVQIENLDLFRISWKEWFKKFDGNTRRAVGEALEFKTDSHSLPFYIRNIESSTNLKRINFLDGAIQPWGSWNFCNNLLK